MPERRNGERRRGASTPHQDRRSRSDRRHPVDRRETSLGHLRNALQTLTLVSLKALENDERRALRAAGERLWLALYELQRRPPHASS